MDVLVLGGTQFLGGHIVEALLRAGHRVSTLNRGRSADALPQNVERLRGDRDLGPDGLALLAGRRWHACIDLSGYTPRQVRPSAEGLRHRVQRYVSISAVMAYGDPQQRPVLETTPRQPPAAEDITDVNGDTYGALKVACEDIVEAVYGERATLLRPQTVTGPRDTSMRYGHWVQRAMMRAGPMLAPGDGSDHLQVIDVRDLARFVVTVIENDLGGAFNLAGPRFTWARFMAMLGVPQLAWVPAHVLQAAGLTFVELPLYRPEHGRHASLMHVSSDKAQAAGLVLTSPETTLHDMRTWLQDQVLPLRLPLAREAELIRAAAQRPSSG